MQATYHGVEGERGARLTEAAISEGIHHREDVGEARKDAKGPLDKKVHLNTAAGRATQRGSKGKLGGRMEPERNHPRARAPASAQWG